ILEPRLAEMKGEDEQRAVQALAELLAPLLLDRRVSDGGDEWPLPAFNHGQHQLTGRTSRPDGIEMERPQPPHRDFYLAASPDCLSYLCEPVGTRPPGCVPADPGPNGQASLT